MLNCAPRANVDTAELGRARVLERILLGDGEGGFDPLPDVVGPVRPEHYDAAVGAVRLAVEGDHLRVG